MRYDHVVCDLDGTLVDTRPQVEESLRFTCAEMGSPLDDDVDLAPFFGPPLPATFAILLGTQDEPTIARAVKTLRAYQAATPFAAAAMPGAAEAIEAFERAGIRLSVATYRLQERALALLESAGLAGYFRPVLGWRDGVTKAELIRDALAHHPSATRPLYVGDHADDPAAARQAGVPFAGYGELSWLDIHDEVLGTTPVRSAGSD